MANAAAKKQPDVLDTNDQLDAPCAKGCAIILEPLAGTVKFVPLTCKSWACPDCSEYLARLLHVRIHNAKPNKFITLTVAQEPHLTPQLAEDIIRKRWPRFIAKVRRHRKDFQYLRVLEYQHNGWPHIHLIARCHYLPHKLLHQAWNRSTITGFVSIKAIHDPAHVGRELTKYIRKSFAINARKGTRRHAYTVSKKFFLDPPQDSPHSDSTTALTFATSTPCTELLAYLIDALGINGTIDAGPGSITFTIDGPYRPSAIPELIRYFSTLPWWKRSHNQHVARNYITQCCGRSPPPE